MNPLDGLTDAPFEKINRLFMGLAKKTSLKFAESLNSLFGAGYSFYAGKCNFRDSRFTQRGHFKLTLMNNFEECC